ncbi:recombination protein RecR [Spiroplasma clarkii]|uniref:toprim domain-containing protein n=1 Tax=Spiroplasma clarkii TaxID=2139 RepID=UPI000B56ADC7|nr:toprim domain-containing protein [Spiroplasma clarkii]ARU90894.1 recombination protein RecR [Spiroplasma clarkii]
MNGEINLPKNIQPENLKIAQLFDRISTDMEIILALNLTFEGEVTANYLGARLKSKCKNITRIARGIPLGGVLDYIDNDTIDDAILNRKSIKEEE